MTRTPQDTFLSDQALAAARDLAAHGTPTVVIEPYNEGPCTWCGCNLLDDMLADDCDNRCTQPAALIMRVHHAGSGERDDFPLCHGHKHDAMRFITTIAEAGGFR